MAAEPKPRAEQVEKHLKILEKRKSKQKTPG